MTSRSPATEPSPALNRAIGLHHATAMVVGTIIGASIFVQPSAVTGLVPSVPAIILVWFFAGILTMFGALVCAELSSIFSQSGGVYIYLKEAFSPAIGFLWGWAMFWVMHSGIIAAVAVIFARYLTYFFPASDLLVRSIAIGCILLLSGLNILGVKQGSTVQTVITLGKVLAIVFIIIAGTVVGSELPGHFVTGDKPATPVTISGFLLAMSAGLFAYGGWHMVTYNAEETVDPRRTIPRALLLGTVTVTVCYIAMNLVYLYVLPLATVAASNRVAADAADALIGSGGGAMMSALVVFSTFGALTGIILSGPRVYLAMARDNLLFKWAGDIHPRYRTPAKALALQAVWASILVATGTYRELFTRVIYTEWIFFALLACGLFVLRRREGIRRAYQIWGYPVVPILFIGASLAVVVNQIISDPRESLMGLSFVLLGLPVYFFWKKHLPTKHTKDHEK